MTSRRRTSRGERVRHAVALAAAVAVWVAGCELATEWGTQVALAWILGPLPVVLLWGLFAWLLAAGREVRDDMHEGTPLPVVGRRRVVRWEHVANEGGDR